MLIGGGVGLILLSSGITYSIMKRKIRKKLLKRKLRGLSVKNLTKHVPDKHWLVLAESVIGKSHIDRKQPCQDNHFNLPLKNNWGIAVVCDGAGSVQNSHLGSSFTAKEAVPRYFKELIEREGWIEKNTLPHVEVWNILAKKELQNCYGALKIFADSAGYEVQSLACTVIIVVYSPLGLLVAHIGDGRAGYKTKEGDWFSALKPHKGEEANQTIFLTSTAWIMDESLQLSEVNVPECRVIDTPVDAFVLMSDGCEMHSFSCSHFDEENQRWSDPNIPFDKFFNPLIEQIPAIAQTADVNEKWKSFLENGTESLKNEPDDKTMILGMLT